MNINVTALLTAKAAWIGFEEIECLIYYCTCTLVLYHIGSLEVLVLPEKNS